MVIRVVLASALLASCHHDEAPSEAAPSTATIKLVDGGAQPRRTFAYAPHGAARDVTVDMHDHMRFNVEWRLDREQPARYHFQAKDIVMSPAPTGEERDMTTALAKAMVGDISSDARGRATAVSA